MPALNRPKRIIKAPAPVTSICPTYFFYRLPTDTTRCYRFHRRRNDYLVCIGCQRISILNRKLLSKIQRADEKLISRKYDGKSKPVHPSMGHMPGCDPLNFSHETKGLRRREDRTMTGSGLLVFRQIYTYKQVRVVNRRAQAPKQQLPSASKMITSSARHVNVKAPAPSSSSPSAVAGRDKPTRKSTRRSPSCDPISPVAKRTRRSNLKTPATPAPAVNTVRTRTSKRTHDDIDDCSGTPGVDGVSVTPRMARAAKWARKENTDDTSPVQSPKKSAPSVDIPPAAASASSEISNTDAPEKEQTPGPLFHEQIPDVSTEVETVEPAPVMFVKREPTDGETTTAPAAVQQPVQNPPAIPTSQVKSHEPPVLTIKNEVVSIPISAATSSNDVKPPAGSVAAANSAGENNANAATAHPGSKDALLKVKLEPIIANKGADAPKTAVTVPAFDLSKVKQEPKDRPANPIVALPLNAKCEPATETENETTTNAVAKEPQVIVPTYNLSKVKQEASNNGNTQSEHSNEPSPAAAPTFNLAKVKQETTNGVSSEPQPAVDKPSLSAVKINVKVEQPVTEWELKPSTILAHPARRNGPTALPDDEQNYENNEISEAE